MTKNWSLPEIVSLDIDETANSSNIDGGPDGSYGDSFPEGVGRTNDRNS